MVEGGATNAVIQRLLGATGDILLFAVVLLTAFTSVSSEIIAITSVLFYDVFLTYANEDMAGREFEVSKHSIIIYVIFDYYIDYIIVY